MKVPSTWIALACVLLAVNVRAVPLEPRFEPPPFLRGPLLTRAATGNTYSYLGRTRFPDARLTITLVEVPTALADTGAKACIEAFVHEHRTRLPALVAGPSKQALIVNDIALETWSWLAHANNSSLSGVIACTIHGRYYLAIAFEDALGNITNSFPGIRRALRSLVLQ